MLLWIMLFLHRQVSIQKYKIKVETLIRFHLRIKYKFTKIQAIKELMEQQLHKETQKKPKPRPKRNVTNQPYQSQPPNSPQSKAQPQHQSRQPTFKAIALCKSVKLRRDSNRRLIVRQFWPREGIKI